MVDYLIMGDGNPVQEKIALLEDKGWVPSSIARELHVTRDAVGKWKRGERYPSTDTLVLEALDRLLKRKHAPKKKLYARGSRQQDGTIHG